MIEDFCKFFSSIEAHPDRMVKDLTVRDYLYARNHLLTCEECKACVERTLARSKREGGIEFSGN